MSDITLLGVICLGLAFYCLYMHWKFRTLMYMFQVVLGGIYEGAAKVEKRGKGYYPVQIKEVKGVEEVI